MTVEHRDQETAALGSLQLAEYNPREMPRTEMEKLKTSLREWGFIQPVVARRDDGLVIGGHQRLAAMREVLAEDGTDTAHIEGTLVPVIFLDDISDDRVKLLNLALNRISGDWNYDALPALLEDLQSRDDISLAGFDPGELSDLLAMIDIPPDIGGGMSPDDVRLGVAAQERRFVFRVESDKDARRCRRVLKAFGMTGPGNAAEAFIAVCKAADAGRASQRTRPKKKTKPNGKKRKR